MGLLDLFSFGKSNKLKLLEDQLNAAVANNRLMVQTFNNSITQYPTWKTLDNATRYCTTDDIYSIVNLIATTAASIPFYAYTKGKDGKLTDAKETDDLAILLEQPFEGMSKFESVYAICVTMLIQGEWLAWKFKPEMGPNKGKLRLFYMAPQNVNIKVTATFPRKIIAYQYVENGQVIHDNIPPSEVIHSKYFNPLIGATGEELRGLSPIKVLAKKNTLSDSITDVTTAQMQNSGTKGILYEKGDYAEIVENAGRRKKDMYDFFTNTSNAGLPYSGGGDLGYIDLALKLADLEVAELGKIVYKKFCNVFCVSDRLLNNDATGSEISDKSARVGLYTNAVLPLLRRIKDSLNMGLATEFPGYVINFDISEIQELQAHYSDMVKWLAEAWWLTPNERREMMDWEKSTEPMFERYFIPSTLNYIEDLTMPLPATGDYGQDNNP